MPEALVRPNRERGVRPHLLLLSRVDSIFLPSNRIFEMGKPDFLVQQTAASPTKGRTRHATLLFSIGLAALFTWKFGSVSSFALEAHTSPHCSSPYGKFPKHDDPFQFLPCTSETLPPALEDERAKRTWAAQFDSDPDHWSWGNATAENDGYDGRGIYLCGYIDVPLDYTNVSDSRIVRLAVTKYQVSGLARVDGEAEITGAGRKSERTIVLNPGGPGGSGTEYLWRSAEQNSKRFSEGKFDVLGWDPRGEFPEFSSYHGACWYLQCSPQHGQNRELWKTMTFTADR